MVLVSDQKTGLHPPNLTMTNEPHLSAHSTRNYFLSHRPSRHLSQAFDRLPAKCRGVVWMRKVEGLSQRDVARRLNIAETTVEKHVARGIRFLAGFLFGDELAAKPVNPTTVDVPESEEDRGCT